MKAKAFLFAIFLFAGMANTFASSDDKGSKSKSSSNNQLKAAELKESSKSPQKTTNCTVSATYVNAKGKTITITLTATCDCTQQGACDMAYEIISIAIPD